MGNQAKYIKDQIQLTIMEMVQEGWKVSDCANHLKQKFGPKFARLIMIDLAIDLGMGEKVNEYINLLEGNK